MLPITADLILQKAVDSVRRTHFPDLPSVSITVRADKYFETNDCNAFFKDRIVLNPKYVPNVSFESLQNTIKHELVHAWVRKFGKWHPQIWELPKKRQKQR